MTTEMASNKDSDNNTKDPSTRKRITQSENAPDTGTIKEPVNSNSTATNKNNNGPSEKNANNNSNKASAGNKTSNNSGGNSITIFAILAVSMVAAAVFLAPKLSKVK